jgi:uncharacterized membrane protein
VVYGAVTLSVAVVIFRDDVELSSLFAFGGAEFAAKFATYFLHERLWLWIDARGEMEEGTEGTP